MSYDEYLAAYPTVAATYTPPPARKSYLCLVCEVVEEGLVADPIRCWACGSEDLLAGYTPRFYNASVGSPDLH